MSNPTYNLPYPDESLGFRPLAEQGRWPDWLDSSDWKKYGETVDGTPLRYLEAQVPNPLLIVAGIHGEEPETTFLVSRALRLCPRRVTQCCILPCANPEGMVLGLRSNARGVDLNRNWPTKDWSAHPSTSRLVLEAPRTTELSNGHHAASEPETQHLLTLINRIQPRAIVSIHAPLACVDADTESPLVRKVCELFHLPWVAAQNYATFGSLGSWCQEHSIPCITLELPRMPLEEIAVRFAEPLASLMLDP